MSGPGDLTVWWTPNAFNQQRSGTVTIAETSFQVTQCGLSTCNPSDFDGDGYPDLIWYHTSTGQIGISTMKNGVPAGFVPLDASSALSRASETDDLHEDRRLDSSSGIDASELVPSKTPDDRDWRPMVIADMNGDNSPDIVWRHTSSGVTGVWYMNGTATSSFALLDTVLDPSWQLVAAADFDNDNQTDLVWRQEATTGENMVWHMNGLVRRETVSLLPEPNPNWRITGAGDFDLDGKADLLWHNTSTGEVVVWYLDGTNYLDFSHLRPEADTGWTIAHVADFDLDGHLDLFWRNYATGANKIWYFNGAAYAGETAVHPVPDTSWGILGGARQSVPGDFH